MSDSTVAARLWRRTKKMPSGCWEWQGYVMPEGYGQIGDGKRVRTTHRVAYELSNGPIPDGQLIEKRRKTPSFSYGDIRRTVYTHWQLV